MAVDIPDELRYLYPPGVTREGSLPTVVENEVSDAATLLERAANVVADSLPGMLDVLRQADKDGVEVADLYKQRIDLTLGSLLRGVLGLSVTRIQAEGETLEVATEPGDQNTSQADDLDIAELRLRQMEILGGRVVDPMEVSVDARDRAFANELIAQAREDAR